jgi:SAM-dependent methyltransferase
LTTQHDRRELRTGGRFLGAVIAALPTGVRLALGDAVRAIGQCGLGRDARILDVGCGSGALLDRLYRAGFPNVSGADPFLARDCTTPEGVPLLKSHLHAVTGNFDLIMFNHSLEHVPDPVATLKDAREKLSDDGICLVRLPTTSSEAWTTYGPDWFQIDAPRHIVVPSRQGMALAADAVGLRVDGISDDSSVAQFIGSEAYRRDIPLTELTSLRSLLKLFGAKQIWSWDRRAARLNRLGRGDQTGFVLRAVSGHDSRTATL